MTNSPLYDEEELPTNPGPGAGAVVNALSARQEYAMNSVKAWTITGSSTSPTKAEMAEGFIHDLGGTPAADFTFDIPASARRFEVRNNTGKIATVQVSGGLGLKVILATGDRCMVGSDGTDVLQVAPSPVTSWRTVSKAADESRNTTVTLADDTDLKFAVEASTKYRVRGVVFFDTAATPDFKYGFAGPAAPTLVRFARRHAIAGAAPAEIALDTAIPTAVSLAGAGTTGGYVAFDIVYHNGSTAGTVSFQWAQDTSDAGATIVRAGSYIEWQKA